MGANAQDSIFSALTGATSPIVSQGTPPWRGGEFLIIAGSSGLNVDSPNLSASQFLIVIVLVIVIVLGAELFDYDYEEDYDYEKT